MQAEDQTDDQYAICPYCGNKHYMESEDHNPSGKVMECNECKMKFHYVTNYSVSHDTNGDCELNGVEHQWWNYSAVTKICKVCDICKARGETE